MAPSYAKSTRKQSSRRRNKATLFSSSNNINLESSPPSSSPKLEDSDNIVDMCFSSNICSTPKAERFRIPEIGTCPPAPKKRRIRATAAAAALSCRRTPLAFFAPPDLELFFYFALRGIQL